MKKFALFLMCVVVLSVGCGSGLPAISVSLAPSAAQAIDDGQSVNITATVTNDSASKGVTWALTGPGTLTNQTTTAVTYTASGTGTATITATSIADTTKNKTLTIAVTPAPVITTASLPAGTEGTAYSQPIAVTGGAGTLTYSVSVPALPAGLSLNSSTGAITGTPTGPNGTASFSVKVTDSSTAGAQSATQALSILINLPPAPTITTASLPAGVEGTAYSQTLAGTCGYGTCTWSITAGSLPAGLSLNSSTGAITGTPTGPNGTTNFTVTLTEPSNPAQTASQALSILINLPPAPVISPTLLPNGNQGTPYSQNLTVSSGLALYSGWTVSSGALPTGVTLSGSGSSATLSGTPTALGTFNFTISVNDSSNPPQTASQAYTVVMGAPLPLSITTTSLPNASYNTAYSTTISATGGIAPYTFSLDGASNPLPAGLGISTSSNQGVISGTPTTAGTFTNIIVDVTDSLSAVAQHTFTLTITAPALVLAPSTSSLPNGTQGNSYTTAVTASGGVPPYTFTLDGASAALPAGLGFSATATQATISGTPTATGTTPGIIVDVTDSESPAVTAQHTYSLAIVPACGTGSESLLSGQYAFVLDGFDSNGLVANSPVAIGATFNADGAGHIATTVGVEDINSTGGLRLNQAIDSANSSYTVGSDHRGCLTIATSAGTQFFRFSLGGISSGVASVGHVIEFDATTENVAGTLRKQNSGAFSTSSISGNFAFGVSAPESGGGKFAAAGVLSLNGGGTVNTTSVLDVNDNGTIDGVGSTYPVSPVSITGGSYSISANGRGTLSFTPTGSSATGAIVYVVSSSEVLVLSSDAQPASYAYTGSARKQSGSFSASSLSAPMVLYSSGIGSAASTTSTQSGIITIPSSGNLSFAGNRNDGGTVTAQNASGTYSVASSGRVTVTGGSHPPIFYLVSANDAFVLFTDTSVESGFFEPQSGSPFSVSSANGTYAFGTIKPGDPSVSDSAGTATFDGAGNVSGTDDDNTGGTLSPGNAFSQTYSIDSNGTGHLPAGCTITTNCESIFIVISPTKAALMDTQSTNPNPALQVADK